MLNKAQNKQVELLSALARRGGGYSWNAFPISDSMDPANFTAKAKAGPRSPFHVPAAVAHYEKGIAAEPETEEDFGEGAAILEALDALIRKSKKRKSRDERAPHGASRLVGYMGTAGIREGEDDGDDRSGTEREKHVSNDRLAAFDRDEKRQAAFDSVMPLDTEILANWHAWLRKQIVVSTGPAMPYYAALRGFLERAKAGRRYVDLSSQEKRALSGIVERIVENAA